MQGVRELGGECVERRRRLRRFEPLGLQGSQQ